MGRKYQLDVIAAAVRARPSTRTVGRTGGDERRRAGDAEEARRCEAPRLVPGAVRERAADAIFRPPCEGARRVFAVAPWRVFLGAVTSESCVQASD